MASMGDPSPRGRTLRGRIGVALTAIGFIAMMLSLILGDAMPTMITLGGVLLFVVGILVMMARGGDDAVEPPGPHEA